MHFNRFALRAFACGFAFLVLTPPAAALEPEAERKASFDQAVFGFGGPVTASDDNPFTSEYEDNFVVGAGYQHFVLEWPETLHFGGEIGLAGRFGESDSAEIWGGVVARYDGFTLFDTARLSPALTFGLSAITSPMVGREQNNEIRDKGDATLLFYLGPELSLSFTDHPQLELFWRVHHRSGARGTLNDMHGAANANTFGLRWRF